MSSPPALKIMFEIAITPSPSPAVSADHLPLTFFDAPWLLTGPVERLFFFSAPSLSSPPHFSSHLVPIISSSLSSALSSFPHLLLLPSSPHPSLLLSPSLPLTIAESGDDFHYLSGRNGKTRDLHRLYSLVPKLPPPRRDNGAMPLAAFQLTCFRGTGICIGVSIHHVACDDCSYMHLVKSWAASCRCLLGVASPPSSSSPPPPPFFDRSIVADLGDMLGRTLSEIHELMAAGPPPLPPLQPSENLVISSFFLGRSHIEKLKKGLLATSNTNSVEPVHCSSFVVACAFSWVCLVKSRNSGVSGSRVQLNSTMAHLLFSVECRERLKPPIPNNYFGNCLRPCFVEVNSSDLEFGRGVFVAAMAIGRAIRELDHGVLKEAEGWFRKIVSLVSQHPMSVGGSPRYRVYDTDFGFGQPIKVELVSIDKTPGTVSLAESPDEHGGIEIGVILPEIEMAEFSASFTGGLENLEKVM